MTNLFKENPELHIMKITRNLLRTEWKTGFGTQKPQTCLNVLGYLDYKNKIAGIGKIIYQQI